MDMRACHHHQSAAPSNVACVKDDNHSLQHCKIAMWHWLPPKAFFPDANGVQSHGLHQRMLMATHSKVDATAVSQVDCCTCQLLRQC